MTQEAPENLHKKLGQRLLAEMEHAERYRRCRSRCRAVGCRRSAWPLVFCPGCLLALPTATRACMGALSRLLLERTAPAARRAAAEVVQQAARRLAAERAAALNSRLSEAELARADELTQRRHACRSFEELLNTVPQYWPRLDCSLRFTPDPVERAENQELADLYDRAQALRGDPRRATRLGLAGL